MWERLEGLVRSWIDAHESNESIEPDAWQELENYLRRDTFDGDEPQRVGRTKRDTRSEDDRRTPTPHEIPPAIRQACFDLEVSIGASKEEIRRSYRRLLRKYHPDRYHNDPQRSRTAAEVTQRISLAFRRLNDYYRY